MSENRAAEKYFFVLVDDEPRIHEAITEMLDSAGILGRRESFHDPLSFLSWLKEQETRRT